MKAHKELLEDMKKASILTGRLSDVQLNTLLRMPLIVLDKIESVSMKHDIVLDPNDKRASSVIYSLKSSQEIIVDEEKLKLLSGLISNLFWPGIVISIKQGKKTLGKIDESGQLTIGKKDVSA